MPADPTTAKDFLLTTDFPAEKVVLLKSGSLTMSGTTNVIPIAHGLPFTPMINGVWSLNPDFAVTYNLGAGQYPSGNLAFPWLRSLEVGKTFTTSGADATNINIGYMNLSTAVTAYYRIYGLEPSDSFADVPFTANDSDPFVLSTDYNYQKLYIPGILTGLGANGTYVIPHNLGWRPRCMFWGTTTSGLRYPVEVARNDTINGFGFKIIVGTNDITVKTDQFYTPSPTLPSRFDYRIYIDEAGTP